MKADWNDAPYRVQRKANNAITWFGSLVFGLSITVGGLYLTAGQVKLNPRAEAQVARLNAEVIRKHNEKVRALQLANQQRYQPPPMEEKNWIRSSDVAQRSAQAQRELQWSNAQTEKQRHRQTSFSDASYVPQGARNVVPATPLPREPAKAPAKKQEIVVVGKAAPKFSDYCPHAEGSIEQRNCRARINLETRNR